MYLRFCTFFIALIVSTTSAGMVRPAQHDDISLKVTNATDTFKVKVEEGLLWRSSHILFPYENTVQYEVFGFIARLRLFYREDGEFREITGCPRGFFYHSLTVEVRESPQGKPYCFVI